MVLKQLPCFFWAPLHFASAGAAEKSTAASVYLQSLKPTSLGVHSPELFQYYNKSILLTVNKIALD